MDIAIVHPSLTVKGGAENVVVWLASGLIDRGHRVRVITTRADRRLFTTVPWNFEIVELGGDGYRQTWSQMRRTARQLRPLLEGADVVNPHNFPANFWTYWAVGSDPGRAIWFCQEPMRILYRPPLDPHVQRLVALRGEGAARSPLRRLAYYAGQARQVGYAEAWRLVDIRRRVRAMDRQVANWFPLVLTNSSFVKSQVELLFGAPVRVCRLGIPIGPRPDEPPRTSGRFELLMVTRLAIEKNVDTALKALRALPDAARASVRLTVIGAGPELAYLQRLRDQLGVGEQVVFRGFVSDAEVDHAYRACDAVIYLSLDETFGLAFAEAAARSRASIGPDHGGPIEFLDDGRTGLTVDPLDPAAVARAILRLAGDPTLRREMGRAARLKVEADYTIDAMVDRYLGLVTSVLRKAA